MQTLRSLPPRQTPHLAVLLTIASLVGFAYLACAATVISVSYACNVMQHSLHSVLQDEIAKYR